MDTFHSPKIHRKLIIVFNPDLNAMLKHARIAYLVIELVFRTESKVILQRVSQFFFKQLDASFNSYHEGRIPSIQVLERKFALCLTDDRLRGVFALGIYLKAGKNGFVEIKSGKNT